MNKTTLPEAAVVALTNGRKIEAIKIVRQEQQLGLKEAHDLVNQYIQKNPYLRENLNNSSTGGLIHLIAFIVVLVVVLYFL